MRLPREELGALYITRYEGEGKMTQTEIRRVFNRTFNGKKNFMTPRVLRFFKRGNLLVELSTGSGLLSPDPIYGVTVLTLDGQRPKLDPSKMFFDLTEAKEYITSLRES